MRTYRNADTPQAIRAARKYADSRGPGENLPTIVRDVCDAFEAGRPVSVETEGYNGWTNRETWAVALWINNDQGWQESAYEALREGPYGSEGFTLAEAREAFYNAPHSIERMAGELIRASVEGLYDDEYITYGTAADRRQRLAAIQDIGSLWRVDWDELGASFLSDLSE